MNRFLPAELVHGKAQTRLSCFACIYKNSIVVFFYEKQKYFYIVAQIYRVQTVGGECELKVSCLESNLTKHFPFF